MRKPRVLIIDDHPVVRMGLRAMLEQTRAFEVCGEAGSTAEALRLLATEEPDLTLLDLMLGGRDGPDFVAECCGYIRRRAFLSFLSMMKRFMPNAYSRPEPSAIS
jgi:DNA-binding NarL/FixJ family response regulator